MEILQRTDAASHGEGHKDLTSRPLHHVRHGIPVIAGSRDVQEDDLIRSLIGIKFCQLHRIAGVPDMNEVDPFDYPAVPDIQAGDDPLG